MRATLAIFVMLSISYSAYGSEFGFTCKNGTDVMEVNVGAHAENSAAYVSSNDDDRRMLKSVIQKSEACEDLSSDVKLGKKKVIQCNGEVFLFDTIYSEFGVQFLASKGGIDVLKNIVLPSAGYKCN